jgi:hypothetical protein
VCSGRGHGSFGFGCCVPRRQKSVNKAPDHMKNSRPVFAKLKLFVWFLAYFLIENFIMFDVDFSSTLIPHIRKKCVFSINMFGYQF